jgi:hypothetical protein
MCYATVETNGHRETYALKSKAFGLWLGRLPFSKDGSVTSRETLASAIRTLEAYALFDCPERTVFVRLAEHQGKIYLDLCDEERQVVEIGKTGWRVLSSTECPVSFRRPHGMLAIPAPERDGALAELRMFMNCPGEIFHLIGGWLIGAVRPRGPYPVLVFHGEQGSAKTTASQLLRSLIDPNLAMARSQPKDPRDLMIAATNGHVCAFDNLSRLPEWFSDALCRLSTGGGFSTRALYSDNEEIIFEATRPVILNGIEELAVRGDLLDRSIIVELPRIEDHHRRPEAALKSAFESARPKLLGALFDAVSGALAAVEMTKIDRLPRMADFATWVTAAEPVLGWQPSTFLRIYDANRSAGNDLSLEDPVADAVRNLTMPWKGTAMKLLAALERVANESTRNSKTWPKLPVGLSNMLRRLAPNLRQDGIDVLFTRTRGRRQITIVRAAPAQSAPVVSKSADGAAGAAEISALPDGTSYEGVF